ncbi:hypothetical protein [Brevibacillus parabrevis]|uniref:Uncharacterized protein n=1 Tax=Brevibacillus parabrevis TaxID=54914 RepID=A0A4Y3PL91_BREPA|nr:hypothetical protein [Brevibacillus parabrevis]RNB94414.1 hypothetical protein EDM60_18670 [Brevibacillus parabrevis]GEB35282.1 hypothetical protein BPA01_48620 [Brevibacillus parabrevis]
MNPYMLVINVVPMPENKNCEDIAGAKAHVWVISADKESAKLRAIDYVNKYLWKVINFEYELEIHKEQIPTLHVDEARLYELALQHGIASDFLAYPKKPGNPDDPVIKRQL